MTVDAFVAAPVYTVAGTGPYAVPHDYAGADEIAVIVRDADGDAQLVRGTDYDLAPLAGASGTVTLTAAAAAARAGDTLRIVRATRREQGWAAQGGAREAGLEAQLDRNVMAVQDLAEAQRRTLRLPEFDAEAAPLPPVAARAGLYLAFAAGTGAPIAAAAPSFSIAEGWRIGSVSAVSSAVVPDGALVITVEGFAAPGDGGGGVYLVRDAEPAHAGKAESANAKWLELLDWLPNPRQFGAKGDRTADDIVALEACLAYAVARGTRRMQLLPGDGHAISRPWSVQVPAVTIIGWDHFDQGDAGAAATEIVKREGFSGAAAVIIGSASHVATGVRCEGWRVNGAGRTGDGVHVLGGGRHSFERVASVGNPTGWGWVVDGVFFARWQDCVSRFNGDSTGGVGGGFLGRNAIRENSDGLWIGGFMNNNGHVNLRFEPRAIPSGGSVATLSQTAMRIIATEFSDTFDHEPGERMAALADIRGGWGVVFDQVRFTVETASDDRAVACVLLGDPDGGPAVEDVTFVNCTFQHRNDGAGPDEWSIIARGAMQRLRILNALQYGTAKFCDLSGVTSGEVFEDCPAIAANQWNDPDRRLRNVRDGRVGPRPGSDGAEWHAGSSTPGRKSRFGSTRTGDNEITGLDFDGGTSRARFGPEWVANLAPRATAPASPAVGDLAYSDGTGSGFDGASGAGVYVYKSDAGAGSPGWVHIA